MRNLPPFQSTTVNPAVQFKMFETHLVFDTRFMTDVSEHATRAEADFEAARLNFIAAREAWLARELAVDTDMVNDLFNFSNTEVTS
jgi:hypothetical protein